MAHIRRERPKAWVRADQRTIRLEVEHSPAHELILSEIGGPCMQATGFLGGGDAGAQLRKAAWFLPLDQEAQHCSLLPVQAHR